MALPGQEDLMRSATGVCHKLGVLSMCSDKCIPWTLVTFNDPGLMVSKTIEHCPRLLCLEAADRVFKSGPLGSPNADSNHLPGSVVLKEAEES